MIEEIISKMSEKLGENKDLVADNFAELMSYEQSNNELITSKDNEISKLKERNDTLVEVNANLLKSVPTVKEEIKLPEEPKQEFNWHEQFDKHGNFIN